MTDMAITCPQYRNEIKLTESLTAPLITTMREQYEAKLADKETEVGNREAAIRVQQSDLTRAKQEITDEIAKRLKKGRVQVAADEAVKAKCLIAQEFEQQSKALKEMNAVLKERDTKLAETQTAQADLIKKECQGEGKQTKTELVYRYLTRPRLRHRVESIVERFSATRENLDRERKVTVRLWAKRVEQIRGVIEGTIGIMAISRVLQAILSRIEDLQVPLLDAPAVA